MSTIEKTYSKSRKIIKTVFGLTTIVFGFFALFLFSPSRFFNSNSDDSSFDLVNKVHADAYDPTTRATYSGGDAPGSGTGSGCGEAGSCTG